MKEAYLLSIGTVLCAAALQAQNRTNIVFICVDDLRTELGCYGNSPAITPNLDRLASDGSLFINHFANVPTCGASRASLLTGMLPHSKEDITNEAIVSRLSKKEEGIIPESMFHHLRRHGYYTVGIGKVSHYVDGYIYHYNEPVSQKRELPYSWDEMLFNPGKWGTGWNAFFGYADGRNRTGENHMVRPYECADVDDYGYADGLTAQLAVEKIKELSLHKQPFCLAIGFFKPHLPFNAPKKYWDLYDEAKLNISPAPDIPGNVNKASLHNSNEFNGYKLGDEKATIENPVSDSYARKLRHAYYACVSYVDAQIGKVIDELKYEGMYENTIIVIWGDHGWHLGDLRVWGKHTLFETALRSTLIFKPAGGEFYKKIDRIVSTIDIYPTIMEMCGISVDYPINGKSFTELFRNPQSKSWEDISLAYFNYGISVRTLTHRLTFYFRNEQPVIELFEYRKDHFERKNVAAQQPIQVERLMKYIEKADKGPCR
jgi:arylsulfatase A-like enzyme